MSFESDYQFKRSLIDKNQELLKSFAKEPSTPEKKLYIDVMTGALADTDSIESSRIDTWQVIDIINDKGRLHIAPSGIKMINQIALDVLSLSLNAFNSQKHYCK